MSSSIEIRRDVLFKLLSITNAEKVDEFISTHEFFKDCKWAFYGAMENNAGIIKAQSPDPVGALVEKITNGIDALLIRKCWDNNIDPTSLAAPQNQKEAVEKFYGTNVVNFSLSEKEIRAIANNTVRIVAEGNKDRPTITVVDFGEGQQPQDFPDTFLSIGHSSSIRKVHSM